MLYQADDIDAPALLLLRLEADALEGNPYLDLIAVIGDPTLGLIHIVRAQIRRLPLDHRVVEAVSTGGPGLHQRSIRLHPEWIHRKNGGLAPIVEGAEQDLDLIVGRDPVPISQRGVDRAVRLEGPDAEMNGGGGVPDEDLGRIGCGHAIGGRELGESGQHCGPGPGRLVQLPVHRDLGLLPGHPHVQLPGPAVIGARWVSRIRVEDEEKR